MQSFVQISLTLREKLHLQGNYYICLHCLLRYIQSSGAEIHIFGEISTCDPFKYILEKPILIALMGIKKSTRIQSAITNCCFATTVKPV